MDVDTYNYLKFQLDIKPNDTGKYVIKAWGDTHSNYLTVSAEQFAQIKAILLKG